MSITPHEIQLPAAKRTMSPKSFAIGVSIACSVVVGAIAWLAGFVGFGIGYAHWVAAKASPEATVAPAARLTLYGIGIGTALAAAAIALIAPGVYRFLLREPEAQR